MSDSTTTQTKAIGPGSLIGRYRIEHLLGSGGMADVFYALHEDLRRPAAIKVLKASLAADETNLQRFMNEARSAAALVHPNIVQVYDVGRDEELRYIAQEYIPGVNLRQYLAAENEPGQPSKDVLRDASTGDRKLGFAETLSILFQILAALNKSSSSGIVHRDIKPENIMLTQDGDVKVADFGLARTFLGDDPKLTRAGTTLGTPMYMSPEQIQDGTVDIRSDLYSLGVTLYHMLAGRPPFLGETQLALAMMHTQADPPSITQFREDVPESLQKLLDRLLEKEPADRLSEPSEVLGFLQENKSGDLSDYWPDRTLPLPRANASSSGLASMEATHRLQTLIGKRRQKNSTAKRWLLGLVAGILWLASLAFGVSLTLKSPLKPVELYNGVPRMATVDAQYRWALVFAKSRASRLDKWRAVEEYFPKNASDLNRFYAGQASIQLARANRNVSDWRKASSTLERTIRDDRMDPFIKAYAYVELAITTELEANANAGELTEDDGRIRSLIDEALKIYREQSPDNQEDLKNQIEDIVNRNADDAPLTQAIWSGAID